MADAVAAINLEANPNARDVEFVRSAIYEFNRSHAGSDNHKERVLFFRDANNKILGGLLGGTYYGYLHVDVLWVDEDQRGQGHGERLLRTAEAEAIARGCRYAHLGTHGFQALGFYEKRGYEIVGELKELPPSDSRYLLRKC